MNLYSIKCLMLTKYSSIKIKPKIDEKINLYYDCNDCSLKKFEILIKKN